MSAKHTPGPWSAHGTVLRDAAGNSIASGGNNRVVVGHTLWASIKLAAAAPDLLEALAPFAALLQEHNNKGDGSTPVFGINDAKITVIHPATKG